MNLYELTGEYLSLMALADDPDIDPEVFADTLEAMDGELEAKADGYAKIIRQLEYESAAYRAESKVLTGKAVTADKKIDRLKKALKESMELTGKTSFKTELFSFGIRKNKPSVVIEDAKKIPVEFMRTKDPEPDKTALYNYLKSGNVLDGVHLEPSESLVVK